MSESNKLKLSDFEVSMLIIERDACQYKKERIDELLNKVGAAKGLTDAEKEKVTKPAAPEAALDVSKLFWEKKQGEKGEYKQTSEKANQNCDVWKQLKAKVKEHKGFWQNGDYKFWFHQQDEGVIDRRKA